MFSQLNEIEFVSQIERKFLSRKRTGGILLIISLAMIGVVAYFGYYLGEEIDKILDLGDFLSHLGENSSDESLRKEAKKTSAEFLLVMGMKVGFLSCALITASIHILVQALYLLFDSRKERLLIEYSKRLRGIR